MNLYMFEVIDHMHRRRWLSVEKMEEDAHATSASRKFAASFVNVLWFKMIVVSDVTQQADGIVRKLCETVIEVQVNAKVSLWSEGNATAE